MVNKTTKKVKPDWQAVEVEFVNGSMTFAELAKTHKIKEGTVRGRASRHQWGEKRSKSQQNVTQQTNQALESRRKLELDKFNEDDLKVAKAIRAKIAKILNASVEQSLSANELRSLAGAHESLQRVARLALGASTGKIDNTSSDGSMTPKSASELTDAQLEAFLLSGK